MQNFESYLIAVGIRSIDYTYTVEELTHHIEYFKTCFNKQLSAYFALEMLYDHINGDYLPWKENIPRILYLCDKQRD